MSLWIIGMKERGKKKVCDPIDLMLCRSIKRLDYATGLPVIKHGIMSIAFSSQATPDIYIDR